MIIHYSGIMELMTDVCPYCLSVSEYHPNPYYYHKCEKCEKECGMSQLLRGIKVNDANEAIKELNNEIEYIKKQLKEHVNIIEEK